MEAQVHCRLTTEPGKPIGLVESGIQGNKGVGVTATVRHPEKNQPQELRAGILLGFFWPLDEGQLCESSSVGDIAQCRLLCWHRPSEFAQIQGGRYKSAICLLHMLHTSGARIAPS